MKENFDRCFVLLTSPSIEGGYGNDKYDPGGATNLGVIQSEYDLFRARKGQPRQSVRNIAVSEAKEIYKGGYWDACRCDNLPNGFDWAVFDAAVNSGPTQSAKWFQRSINDILVSAGMGTLRVDGKIGPLTVEEANAVYANHAKAVIKAMQARRLTMLRGLSTWWRFGKGWSNRVYLVGATATVMVGVAAAGPMVAGNTVPKTQPSIWREIWTWIKRHVFMK
jgi:lysozyme family protein